MNTAELVEAISRGEDTSHQFKSDFTNADALAAEIVAFSNTAGGRVFIGVRDDGTVSGLSASDVGRLNQLISNAASQNVRPPVNPLTEIISHPDGNVLMVDIPKGISKPYMDKTGTIWVKSGADKRRATSREEIQRIFQQGGLLHADGTLIPGLGVADVSVSFLDQYLEEKVGETLEQQGIPLGKVLENMNLAQSGTLNLAGALLFAKHPEVRLPAFIVKAVAFPGTAYLTTVSRNVGCECFRVGGVADHVHLARLSRTLTTAKELGKDYPKLETDCRNSADIGRNSA